MAPLKENFGYWITKFSAKENIKDYSFDLEENPEGGVGFVGDISYLIIKARKDDKELVYKIVLKSALNNSTYRKIIPIVQIYDREIRWYNEILPELFNNLKENLVEGHANVMYKIPKCFYACQEEFKECLMLENMKCKGFQMHDSKKCMNLNHALMVAESYAHHHGLSYVYKQYHPVKFYNYAKSIENMWGIYLTALQVIKAASADIEKLLNYFRQEGYEDIAEKYKGFHKEMEEVLVHLQVPNDPSLVITHGDCWNNNLMFKYDKEDKEKLQPIDLCLLDFQFYRMASPAFDLSHFLYCCTDKEVLKDLDLILQAYHASLTNFLKQFNCDVKDFITLDELKTQFGVYGKYGVCFAFFMVKMQLCDASETPNAESLLEKGDSLENVGAVQYKDKKMMDYYYERMKDVFTHFANNFM